MCQFLLLNDTSDKAVGHILLHATKQEDNLSDTCNILYAKIDIKTETVTPP